MPNMTPRFWTPTLSKNGRGDRRIIIFGGPPKEDTPHFLWGKSPGKVLGARNGVSQKNGTHHPRSRIASVFAQVYSRDRSAKPGRNYIVFFSKGSQREQLSVQGHNRFFLRIFLLQPGITPSPLGLGGIFLGCSYRG